MIDVTVKVPEGRLADFYSMYGRWLEGGGDAVTEADGTAHGEVGKWAGADVNLARAVWGRFSEPAVALLSILIDEPDREFPWDELAQKMAFEGGRTGIAALLTWPGRHCREAGREACWRWRGAEGETTVYWMPSEIADLFRQARDA